MRTIQVLNASRAFVVNTTSLSRLFKLLDKWPQEKIPQGELSIALLDDAEICRLHANFLNDPSPTDVITFPADPNDNSPGWTLAGEICVSLPQAQREAPKHGKTTGSELLLYLIHGWLHLAGHDDLEETARVRMRAAEKAALNFLAQHNMQTITLKAHRA
ncbi:MAG: rRNA maturation RNase YbeY [Puniceicoccales bacterium]|jgi:probable rRNA maturation factor|nr:rRNA maturation RNase YbeY [Puniceicoccales bacterium]